MKISRRDFLKGTSAAALSLAATSLIGCSVSEDKQTTTATVSPEASASTTAASVQEKIAAAYLNPQSEDYRSNDKFLTNLFSPITMGSITSSHRMVKSAAGSATYLAGYTDELLQYYVNLAKGGVELIYVEGEAFVLGEDGKFSDEAIEFGKKLVEECGKYGAVLGFQWAQFGAGENEMTVEQIHAIQDIGVGYALGLKEMGFKAIEINAAGFNMGEHFLSRFHNTREDEYGYATIENRARFVTECITKIKEACGSDFNVQILIDCLEENDNIANNPTLFTLDSDVTNPHNLVTTVEEGIALSKKFEEAGADSMHLRLGPQGHHVAQFGSDLYWILNGVEGASGFGTQFDFKKHWQGLLISDTSGCGNSLDVVAKYKKALSIPCGAVTYMDPAHAPDFFEQALEDGKVDFFMMTRPLTVDTEYVNKLKDGRIDEIAPCTRCLHCHIGSNEANAAFGYCRVNALTQRVMREGGPETYELPEIETKKNVMVIGGGPAGMEAARIAAQRGHSVTLYEKKGFLGGMLDFAATVKGPHENLGDFKNYLIHQCELNNVQIETGKNVDQDMIKEVNPDVVVLATGGVRQELSFDTDNSAPVVDIESAMFTEMGENVVVYGSNAQAFDMALWLTVHKKHVTMVSPSPLADFDMQQSQHAKRMMTTALYALGFNSYAEATIDAVKNNVLTFTSALNGVSFDIPCDAVVNCADMLADTSLIDGLDVESYAIGDAMNPFNIALAVRSGNDVGRKI